MKSFALLALAFYSTTAFSHQTYIGQTKNGGDSCVLEIENIYYEGNEERKNLRIDVSVHVQDEHAHASDHNDHDTFHFTLKPQTMNNIYSGLAANGKDLLNVSSHSNEELLPNMFAMKWLHGNHFHSMQCLNLKLADHSHE